MMSIMQLSNWFTSQHINKVLTIFLVTQFAGYMTPMSFIENLDWSVKPLVYFACGGGIILISILDHYLFAFHPLEKNIFLDQD